jgi:hypothetical protein
MAGASLIASASVAASSLGSGVSAPISMETMAASASSGTTSTTGADV